MTLTDYKPDQPDSPPRDLHIGAINPFALVEALLGRKIDWTQAANTKLMSSILQTDYEEMFDMRFGSIIFAGLRLKERGDKAELIPAKEMHTLTERDLVTPDFSRVEKLGDLGDLGIKDIDEVKVKHAVMSNGNLRLTLQPPPLGKTLCSSEMTSTLRELCTPFRIIKDAEWSPPNGTWTDISSCHRQDATVFSNPVQGATGNSWFIAALMSVAWSDPTAIKHFAAHRPPSSSASWSPWFDHDHDHDDDHDHDNGHRHRKGTLAIKFYSKGGDKDAPTATIPVNCELPTNNSSSLLMYCRPSHMNTPQHTTMGVFGGEMWPALYEKAFASWLSTTSSSSSSSSPSFFSPYLDDSDIYSCSDDWTDTAPEHPDLTQTAHGDPVKAMAQLTNKSPHYFLTAPRRGQDLLGLVRSHCVNLRTVYPCVAWTHPSDGGFRGCTLVGNMAYSVLGWAAPRERKQYIVLRHPWGVTEKPGRASYPGGVVVGGVDVRFWAPIGLVDAAGVFAIEAGAFEEYFAGMGVAK